MSERAAFVILFLVGVAMIVMYTYVWYISGSNQELLRIPLS